MARTPYDLRGRVVLITGPARGIGAETARQLDRAGARLALVGLEPERLEALAGELSDADWWEADVTDSEALEAAVEGAVERFGGIDVVIANAGIAPIGTVETMDPAAWERTIDVNLLGVWRTVRAALPHVIERRGYVLPIASLAAALHNPLMTHYNAAKSGVEAFANGLRQEVRHHGVAVGVAYFGFIDTDMTRTVIEDPTIDTSWQDDLGPAGRMSPVERAGEVIVRGIERRARWVYEPRWIPVALVGRTALQGLVELAGRQGGRLERVVRQANEAAAKALTPGP